MAEDEPLSESSLEETQSVKLGDLVLPMEEDIAALAELVRSMENASSDACATEAIEKGLLKDMAPSFAPQSRQTPPSRENSVSAKSIADLSDLFESFSVIASTLGYKPPAPKQRRYKGPALRLRYCQVARCDMSMRQIQWPIRLSGCTFTKAGSFMGASFAAEATFEQCNFEAGADFGLAKFQGDADFSGATFTAEAMVSATFAGVTFFHRANFDLTSFTAAAQFDYGNFEGPTRFFRTQFGGPASFAETKFQDQAQFEFASFAEGVEFSEVFFNKAPEFHETKFSGLVDFSSTNIQEYLDLRTANFDPEASLNLADLRIRASNVLSGNIRLTSTQLRRRRFWPPGYKSLLGGDSPEKIRLAARRKRERAIEEDPGAAEEARRQYHNTIASMRESLTSACTQYGVLEENFRAQGDPDSRSCEDFCHYRYHDLWRQIHRGPCNPLCWANWFFLKMCFGYGVYPLRILIAGLVLIAGFACLYATTGFGLGGSDWDIISESRNIVPIMGDDGQATSPAGEAPVKRLSDLKGWRRWGTALYFSTATFTTVGYGDWRPSGSAQAAAGSEGLLGVVVMSVFTVVFARKFIR
ncbi:MAG: hypothetical protein J7M14_04475 [Planctomycetes bacterium]|nr:hypothetical protein [Planctomycetota bacterium]